MSIAILLVLYTFLGSSHQTARIAAQQSAIYFWFTMVCLARSSAFDKHRLDFIKKLFGDNRLVSTLVDLALIHEVPVVKRIRQNTPYSIFFVFCTFTARNKPLTCQKISDVFVTTLVLGVQFKSLYDNRRDPFIYDDTFTTQIIYLAEWCTAGVFATPHFLTQASLGILGQIVHVVFRLTKCNREHEFALRCTFKPKCWELERCQSSLIE